ncbi:MAG: hypothetical protein ACM3KF_02545 [Acidobacteriota bacterium]
MNEEPTQNPVPAPTPPPVAPPSGVPVPGKGLAIASLVLGILATLSGIFFIGGLFGIVAIVLGIIALQKKVGKGMSITGIITGALGILGTLGAILLIVLAVPALQTGSRDTQRKNDVTRISGMVVSQGIYTQGSLPSAEDFVAGFDASTFTIKLASGGEPTTDTAVYTTGQNCDGTTGDKEYAIRVLLENGQEYCQGS